MRSSIVILLAIVVTAVGGWLAFGSTATPLPTADDYGLDDPRSSGFARVSTGRSGLAEASFGDDEVGVVGGAYSGTRSVVEGPVHEGPVWLTIRTRDKKSAEPVPRAQVWWLPPDFRDNGDEHRRERSELGLVGFYQKHGTLGVTDDEGALRLEFPGSRIQIVALSEDGSLYGQVTENAGYARGIGLGDVVVEMQEDLSFDVLVKGPDDQPVPYASVSLFKKDNEWPWSMVRAGEDGLARFRHLQWLFDDDEDEKKEEEEQLATTAEEEQDASEAFELLAVGHGGYGEGHKLGEEELRSGEPFEIELPEWGEIRITLEPGLVDIVGRVHPGVSRIPAPGEERSWDPRARLSNGAHEAYDAEGVAVLRPVLTGHRFNIYGGASGLQTESPGPKGLREVVDIDLRLASGKPVVVMYVLGPDGKPYTEKFQVMFRRIEKQRFVHRETYERTGDAGKVICVLGRTVDEAVEVLVTADGVDGEGGAATARIVLDNGIGTGEIDLGNVHMELPSLLVSGVVHDTEGVEIPHEIGLRVEQEEPRVETDERRQRRRRFNQNSDGWENAAARLVWFDEGRFAFYGESEGRPMRLVVSEPLVVIGEDGGLPFVPGTRGLDVTVAFGGGVKATFLVNESTPWKKTAFSLRQTHGLDRQPVKQRGDKVGRQATPEQDAEQKEAGRIEVAWSGMQPGIYELCLWGSEVGPLMSIPDLVVQQGSVLEDDARVSDIDLRSAIRGVKFRVRKPDGEVMDNIGLFSRAFGSPDEWVTNYDEGTVMLVCKGPIDVRAFVNGYEPLDYFAVESDRDVVLHPAPESVFRLVDPPELQEDWRLSLVVEPQISRTQVCSYRWQNYYWSWGQGWTESASARAQFEDGLARVKVGRVGLPWKVSLSLVLHQRGRWRSHQVEVDPASATVLDVPSGVFDVRVPIEAWPKEALVEKAADASAAAPDNQG